MRYLLIMIIIDIKYQNVKNKLPCLRAQYNILWKFYISKSSGNFLVIRLSLRNEFNLPCKSTFNSFEPMLTSRLPWRPDYLWRVCQDECTQENFLNAKQTKKFLCQPVGGIHLKIMLSYYTMHLNI